MGAKIWTKDIDIYLRKLDWFAISTYPLGFRVVSKQCDMQYAVAISSENRVVSCLARGSRAFLALLEVLDLPLYVGTQGEFYLVSGTTKLSPKEEVPLCRTPAPAGRSSGFSKYDIPVNVSRLSTIRGHAPPPRCRCRIKPLLPPFPPRFISKEVLNVLFLCLKMAYRISGAPHNHNL